MFDSDAVWWLGFALALTAPLHVAVARARLGLRAPAGGARSTLRRLRPPDAVARLRITFAYDRDVVRACMGACARRGARVAAVELGGRDDAPLRRDGLATVVLELRGAAAARAAELAPQLRRVAGVHDVRVERATGRGARVTAPTRRAWDHRRRCRSGTGRPKS